MAAPQRAAHEPSTGSRDRVMVSTDWSPSATQSTTIAPTITSLAMVVRFWVLAEARMLRQFQSESPRMRITTVALEATGPSGTNSAPYSTKTTATAAIEAVWMTAKRLQP